MTVQPNTPPTPATSEATPLTLQATEAGSLESFTHYFPSATRFHMTGKRSASRDPAIQKRTDAIIMAGNGAAQKIGQLLKSQPGSDVTIPAEQVADFADALSALTKASAAMAQIMFTSTLDRKNDNQEIVAFRQGLGFTGWKLLNSGTIAASEAFLEHFPQHKEADMISSLRGAVTEFCAQTRSVESTPVSHICPQKTWQALTEHSGKAAESLLEGRQFACAEAHRKTHRNTRLSYI